MCEARSALSSIADLVWINVTPHPTAEWIARQVTEAFPWDEAPRYLIRDQDGIYGAAVTRRLRAPFLRRPRASLHYQEHGVHEPVGTEYSIRPGRSEQCASTAAQ